MWFSDFFDFFPFVFFLRTALDRNEKRSKNELTMMNTTMMLRLRREFFF